MNSCIAFESQMRAFQHHVVRPFWQIRILLACSHVCGSRSLSNAPPISCNKLVCNVLRRFFRVVHRRLPVQAYDVMRYLVFPGLSNEFPYNVLFYLRSAFIEISLVFFRRSRVLHFQFDPLQRWPQVVFFH